jgi:hypothetical protein
MKIEIDLDDRRQLEKTRAELQRYLGIIEFALQEKTTNGNGNGHLELLQIPTIHTNIRNEDASIMAVIDSLPKRFSTTDVVIGMGDEGKEKRGAIKSLLKRGAENGIFQIATQGRGRRPTEWEKV